MSVAAVLCKPWQLMCSPSRDAYCMLTHALPYIYIYFFYQTFVSAAKEAGILTGSLRELTVGD